MSWDVFWATLIGQGVVLGGVAALLPKIIEKFIDGKIAIKVERYKSELAEQRGENALRYSWVAEHRAQAIAGAYKAMLEASEALYSIVKDQAPYGGNDFDHDSYGSVGRLDEFTRKHGYLFTDDEREWLNFVINSMFENCTIVSGYSAAMEGDKRNYGLGLDACVRLRTAMNQIAASSCNSVLRREVIDVSEMIKPMEGRLKAVREQCKPPRTADSAVTS